MGDMNADCDYLKKYEFNALEMTKDKRFKWLGGDTILDTTLAEKICYYDRIVLCGGMDSIADFTGPAVDRFDQQLNITNEQALLISDHYPVYVNVTWKGRAAGQAASQATVQTTGSVYLWVIILSVTL